MSARRVDGLGSLRSAAQVPRSESVPAAPRPPERAPASASAAAGELSTGLAGRQQYTTGYNVVCGCHWPVPGSQSLRERIFRRSWSVVGRGGDHAPSGRDAGRDAGRGCDCATLAAVGAVLLQLLLLLLLLLLVPLLTRQPHPTSTPAPAPPAQPMAPPTLKPPPSLRRLSLRAPSLAPPPRAAVPVRALYAAGHARPHPELCGARGARLRLLVLVSSAPAHAAAREAVRLTWGHFAARADVAVAFVLGAPPAALRAALDAEDALYGDVIEGRSVDSYSNLTLKTLSMLEWAHTYCPRAPRLLKTDDDVFINVPRLLQFIAEPARVNATGTIWGKVLRGTLPDRSLKSKDYVSPLQFPGAVFPDYASGRAYLLTADCAPRLLQEADRSRYMPLEDVFVTGVLAARLRLRREHAPEFYNKRMELYACNVQAGVAMQVVWYHEQFDLWRKLLNKQTKCTS